MNKYLKVFGWIAVIFYCIDIVADYYVVNDPMLASVFPMWIRIFSIVLYQIPLIIILYLAIKQLRGDDDAK